jgi:hypothetical protein
MNIFRVMKAVYHLLDPAIEPSTVDDTKHIATLEYTVSQTKPGRPGLLSAVIHFRLSTEIVTRFSVMFCEMQIEDKVQNMCIPVPRELEPVMMNIYEFILKRSAIKSIPASECDLAHRIWKGLQVEVRANLYTSKSIVIVVGRNTINAFFNWQTLVTWALTRGPPYVLYVYPDLSTATAVKLHRAVPLTAVDRLNRRSRGVSHTKRRCNVFHALKSSPKEI